jgi:hypothetical protein
MSGDSQQWEALDSQHERLVGVCHPQLRGDAPGSTRKPWHRRVAEAALRADGSSQPARPSRRRAASSS